MAAREPRIVAELGRPETPEEAADRKAAASQRRRANQTAFNLVIATLASLGIVLLLVLVVVRPAPEPAPPVDYETIAVQSGVDVVAPELPDTWSANSARIETVGGVRTWTIGFITPATQFIALDEGLDANDTWLAAAVHNATATGSATVGGLDWTTYDRRNDSEAGNHAFAMSAEIGDHIIVLHGTADDAEFQTLAAAVASEVSGR